MNKNKERIEKIKEMLHFDSNAQLARAIGVDSSQISKWSMVGMSPSLAKLIDLLLNRRGTSIKSIAHYKRLGIQDEALKHYGIS